MIKTPERSSSRLRIILPSWKLWLKPIGKPYYCQVKLRMGSKYTITSHASLFLSRSRAFSLSVTSLMSKVLMNPWSMTASLIQPVKVWYFQESIKRMKISMSSSRWGNVRDTVLKRWKYSQLKSYRKGNLHMWFP